MRGMTLRAIAEACNGVYYGSEDNLDKEVTDMTTDSRKVQNGGLFVAICGERTDGHQYIDNCFNDGALCVISEKELEGQTNSYIKVKSSLQALKDMALLYRNNLDIKVVGITGSVGKTSTKETISYVLNKKYKVLKTEGNFNNEIGLPLTVFRLRDDDEVAVLEMGISHFGDMEPLAKIARPDVCVITNIGYAHLENLGTRDGILKEKTSMFDFMNPDGTVILNGDDDKLRGYTSERGIQPVYFGLDPACPFHAEQIQKKGLKGTVATFVTPSSSFSAHVSIPGDHMISNALAGVAVGYALGMKDEEIIRGIEKLVPIAGRNNLIEAEHYTIIDDCYNANPASMKSSLDVLTFADTRTVAILGDMGELGADAEVGTYAVKKGISLLICIGTLSSEMANAARTASEAASDSDTKTLVYHFDTKEAFYQQMDQLLKEQDTVLVKASHFMEFPEIVKKLQEQ